MEVGMVCKQAMKDAEMKLGMEAGDQARMGCMDIIWQQMERWGWEKKRQERQVNKKEREKSRGIGEEDRIEKRRQAEKDEQEEERR